MVTKITVGALGNWHNIGNCLSYSPLSYFKCQQNFEIQWPRTNGKIMLPTKFLCQQVMFATLHVAFCSRRLAYVSMWLCGTTARLQQRKLLEYTKTYFLNHASEAHNMWLFSNQCCLYMIVLSAVKIFFTSYQVSPISKKMAFQKYHGKPT
jgi:hypothetical protein